MNDTSQQSQPRLYTDLASWWHVLSTPDGYKKEAEFTRQQLELVARIPLKTMLELGSGGGNNAFHLKAHYQLTLTDIAPGMVEVSRELNPECEHMVGDMRALRLDREFDAVFIHDAIGFMASETDLFKALQTAAIHCRNGGAAIFEPDFVKETFKPETGHGGHDVGGRSLRYLEWFWDPDETDDTYMSQMVYLLREGDGPVRTVSDEASPLGLFSRTTWFRLIREAGFQPFRVTDSYDRDIFLGLKD